MVITMLNKVLILTTILVLSGCSVVSNEMIVTAQRVCSVNGSVRNITIDSDNIKHAICNNGAKFELGAK